MTLIANTADLTAACARLSSSPVLTVDTEFLRDSTFWPKLCLVQVAGDDFHCAIDPLAPGIDLAPFYALMKDETILKVFHSARQDVEIFVLEMGAVPRPLFDTQVAAMVCGFGESVGYETLVNKLTGAKLDKAVRFTDWSKRPLSKRQIDYALGDVTHLRDVYAQLNAMLEENGRAAWLKEEMAVLTDAATYRLDPEDAWKRLKPRSRNRRFLGLVHCLAAWRETEAQRRNVPRNRVIRDDIVMELAAHPPHNADELAAIRGFSKRSADSNEGLSLLQAVARAEAMPDADLPQAPHEDRVISNSPLSDLMKIMLKLRCQENGVAPKLVASSSDLDLIAQGDKTDLAALQGWRYELFGRDAEAIRDGRLGLAVRDGRLVTLDIQEDGTAVIRA